ncbi:MAG: hypothetical protein GY811_22350 [Myxococcales bacterium]|nr:hypothetical protein [Myxococcales bacterium]
MDPILEIEHSEALGGTSGFAIDAYQDAGRITKRKKAESVSNLPMKSPTGKGGWA